MTCTCGSDRIGHISAKCSDLSNFSYKEKEHDGYVPNNIEVGGGDYIEFSFCLDCGRIQGAFPISEETVNESFE